jgi:hypothetical protein
MIKLDRKRAPGLRDGTGHEKLLWRLEEYNERI